MEIKIENVKAALNTADENVKNVLLALFPEMKEEVQQTDNRPITERVKTFNDACHELGEYNHFVEQYRAIEENANFTSDGHDIYTYLKLRIIAAALNEGWEPQFIEGEQRWYPWFALWTKEELIEKSEEWRIDRQPILIGDYSGDFAAFSFERSFPAAPEINPRLCFKSEALAAYCGKQFTKLWADFNLIKKP